MNDQSEISFSIDPSRDVATATDFVGVVVFEAPVAAARL